MKNIGCLIILLLLLIGCEEAGNNGSGDPNEPLVFTSLLANRDLIEAGDTTKIIAKATGYSLEYYWKASAGDILVKGNSPEAIYTASPCQIGTNTIECNVKDGNGNVEKKELTIVVE